MDYGSVYLLCGCRDETTRKLFGTLCPGLRSPSHGSWYFSAELPSPAGNGGGYGGFATRPAAAAALASPAAERALGRFLEILQP